MQQKSRAGQMLQETKAQTGPLRGALDQAGDIRHDKTALKSQAHHPKIRH